LAPPSRMDMDFDFERIAVPFRMQPGLQRIAPAATALKPLSRSSALFQEKRDVVDAGRSRHGAPAFDAGPALRVLAQRAADAGAAPHTPVELVFEEDFAVLDGSDGTLPWLCVCVPSHWAPEDKVGLDFARLHAPVADNAALISAAAPLVALVTGGECWERYVWTLTPSGRYDQHPGRCPRTPWPATPGPAALAGQCWLRVERQTFFPVGQGTQQAIFAIRVMLQPLARAVQTPDQARRLRDSLATMTPAVLDYKALVPARDRILSWLDSRV
jgi:dimethylamine monooxygenase subunit A